MLFGAVTHLGWEAVRNINLFGLVSGVMLCANWSDIVFLRRQRLKAIGGRRTTEPEVAHAVLSLRRKRMTQAMCLSFIGWIIAVISGMWSQWSNTGHKFRLGEIQDSYIHKAAQFAGQPGFPNRAFVGDWGQAGVYIFHNAPERKVFMDGRLEVNSQETFLQYESILQAMSVSDPSWQLSLRDSAGNYPVVILDTIKARNAIQGLYNTPGWRLVYADRAAAVFLDRATADRLKLPPADPKQFVDGN